MSPVELQELETKCEDLRNHFLIDNISDEDLVKNIGELSEAIESCATAKQSWSESEQFEIIIWSLNSSCMRICGHLKSTELSVDLFKAIERLIKAAKDYNKKLTEGTIDVPIIVWPPVPDYVKLYSGRKFTSTQSSELPVSVHKLELGDLSSLTHATSPESLARIFCAEGKPTLKPNLDNDSNITSFGLLFCSVNIDWEYVHNEEETRDQSIPKYVFENRYGSCVLTFKPDFINLPGNKYYFLGTKVYKYEYCQAILVDRNDVFDSISVVMGNCDDFKVQTCSPESEYSWEIKYDPVHKGNWTNPELVFPHELLLSDCSELQIKFSSHSCNTRRKPFCRECCILLNINDGTKADKFDMNGVHIDTIDYVRNYDERNGTGLAIMIFALAIPLSQRVKIEELQRTWNTSTGLTLFNEDQFTKITEYWKKHRNYFYVFRCIDDSCKACNKTV